MNELSKYFGEEGFAAPEDSGDEYGLIPVAWYPVEITKVEIRENKPKEEGGESTGARFVVEFTIFGESYANRKVWNDNGFNFINASQQAQAIGQRELGRLTRACGYGENDRLRDENELLGKQLEIYAEVKPGKGEYKDRNIATKFRPLGSGDSEQDPAAPPKASAPKPQSAPAPAAAPAQSQAPAAPKKRPWEK